MSGDFDFIGGHYLQAITPDEVIIGVPFTERVRTVPAATVVIVTYSHPNRELAEYLAPDDAALDASTSSATSPAPTASARDPSGRRGRPGDLGAREPLPGRPTEGNGTRDRRDRCGGAGVGECVDVDVNGDRSGVQPDERELDEADRVLPQTGGGEPGEQVGLSLVVVTQRRRMGRRRRSA